MRHLLKAAQLVQDDDRAITYAIDTVASSKDDKLANQLIDFLLGSDGLPKVTIIFKCYIKYKYQVYTYFFLKYFLNRKDM